MPIKTSESPETVERKRNLRKHSAAYDAMCASRPLKPPPLRLAPHAVSAGAAALAKEKRNGVYEDTVRQVEFGIFRYDDESDYRRPLLRAAR